MESLRPSFTRRLLQDLEDRPAEAVAIGGRYVAVRVGNRIGLARRIPADDPLPTSPETPLTEAPPTEAPPAGNPQAARRIEPSCCTGNPVSPEVGERLAGRRLARLIFGTDPIERVVAAAAINAQLDLPGGVVRNVFDVILELATKQTRIGIVGAFPFVPRLRQRCGADHVLVFEQRPLPGCLPASQVAELLPGCDLAVITGSAFANGTLDGLLALPRPTTLIIGPSTPLSPLLFEYGVDLLAGMRASDPRIVEIVAADGGTHDFKPLAQEVLVESPRSRLRER